MASSGNLDFPYSPPPPPSSSPNDNTTIVVIVFVSFCGVLFFSFLAAALCCFLQKKKKKTTTQEADVVHVDEHLKMKEAIVEGPHGPQAVVLELEDDVHADEIVRKNEKLGPSCGSAEGTAALCCPFKKKKKTVEETDIVHVDEHLNMKEAIARGQHHGPEPEAVVLEIDDDVHVDKVVIKNEKVVGEGLQATAETKNTASDHGLGAASSSGSNDHSSLQHKH